MKNISFSFFLSIFFNSASYTQIYYVDNQAQGQNAGTCSTDAWQSFADINWNLSSFGSTIYISIGTNSNTYYENILSPKLNPKTPVIAL